MNSYLSGVPGTPDIDDEFIEQQKAEEELAKQQQETAQPEATASPQQPTTKEQTPEPVGPDPQVAAETEQREDEEQEEQSTIEVIGEAAAALPVGVTDFAVDFLNLVPGVEIPKVPEFENEVTQTVREMSSIILPTIGLGGLGAAGLGAKAATMAGKLKKAKFLVDPMVKKIGGMAFSAGTGAFVDYTVEINQTDENLAGTLKQNWPSWYGWIPEDLATLPTDGADVKRAKNVTEGVYLGVGTDVLIGGLQLLKNVRGLRTTYVPKSEKAGVYTEKYNAKQDYTPEEAVNFSAEKRVEALDNIGEYNYNKAVEKAGGDVELALSEPIYGVHDLYGEQEIIARSVDGDVNLAAIDAWQVATNKGGSIYGRVGSLLPDGLIKRGLDLDYDMNVTLRGIGEQLKDTDIDVKFPNGDYASAKEIAKVGDEMAEKYWNMPIEQMKAMFTAELGEVSKELGTNTISSVGMEAARKLIKKYTSDLVNMDQAKAETYLATSLSGQVSDTAQGIRLTDGTPAIDIASEQLIDRLEYLMAMRGRATYVRGRALNLTNMWNRLKMEGSVQSKSNQQAYASRIDRIMKEESNDTLRAIDKIRMDAKMTTDVLREVKEKNPEYFNALLMAYEFTDGKVNTMASLNKFLKESTGTIRKAIIDGDVGTQSVVLQGFWSNVYNSTLSAFATPIKAGISNMAGLVEKPLGAMIGGLRFGEGQQMRRAIYQYGMDLDVLHESLKYMGEVFKRSATEPNVADLGRENIFVKNQDQIDILKRVAAAKEAEGDLGPMIAVERIQAMNDLANHPWLRFGNRAMQALDGFTQTMIAHAEARGRAFDFVTDNGKKTFTEAAAKKHYDRIYKGMFDEDGLINDDVVKFTSGEIAMSVDNEATNAVSGLVARFPIMKPFLLFTKTPVNDLILAKSYSPHNLFMMEYQNFKLKPQDMAKEDIDNVLKSRGLKDGDLSKMSYEQKFQKYGEIRADLYGRAALGTLMVSSAVGLFMTDRITGNGLADKQKQALRRETGWKPRSIRLPGGNWISYDNLGPVSNWFAAVADVADNMDSLTPNDISEQFRKLGVILAASVTDKSFMAGLEPFLDVARGDVGALNRWAGSFLVAANAPMSSQMAEISRLMDPGLKEVQSTTFDMARNRLPFLKSQMPQKYDWIDGDRIGYPDKAGNMYEGFMTRVWNNYMPWKVSGKISEEKEFLQMVEFDARPSLRTNGRGVEYTPEQRSEITNIMGQRGFFLEGIKRVMRTADAKQFRKNYMKAVKQGLPVDLSDFEGIHKKLRFELRNAMNAAAALSSERDAISRKQFINETVSIYLQRGQQDAAREFLDRMEAFSY